VAFKLISTAVYQQPSLYG